MYIFKVFVSFSLKFKYSLIQCDATLLCIRDLKMLKYGTPVLQSAIYILALNSSHTHFMWVL